MIKQRHDDRPTAENIRDRLSLWTMIAQAGVITKLSLTRLALAERESGDLSLDRAKVIRNQIDRDLQALLDENLIVELPGRDPSRKTPRAFSVNPADAWHFLGMREYASPLRGRSKAPMPPTYLTLDPDDLLETEVDPAPLATDPTPEERRALIDLAYLEGLVVPQGPGAWLIDELQSRFALRFKRDQLPRLRSVFQHRGQLPTVWSSVDAIAPEVWETLLRAIHENRPIAWTPRGRVARKAVRLWPRQIVILNERPWLYGRLVESGRFQRWPLHRALRVSLLDEAVSLPQPPEDVLESLIQQAWGLDVRGSLAEIRDGRRRVRLRFRGGAFDAMRADPGCEGRWCDARTAREGVFELETIVGPHFLRWLRHWGPEVEVLEPEDLRDAMREEARRVLARHGARVDA